VKLQVELEGNTYDVEVEVVDSPNAPDPKLVPMSPGSTLPHSLTAQPVPPVPVVKRRKLRPANLENVCRSPMCGIIVAVNVKMGQFVEEDDVVLVLEAMKMETAIRAPRSGHIKAIRVRPADQVAAGQVLVEIADLTAETGCVE
jgi:biotin carboxyl carrier protein